MWSQESRVNVGLAGGLVLAVGGTLGIHQQWVAAGVVAVIGAVVVGAALWRK